MDHTPLGNGSHEPIYVPPCRLSGAALRRKDAALAALDALVASGRPLDGRRPRALTAAEYRAAVSSGAAAASHWGDDRELARWQALKARIGSVRSPAPKAPRAKTRVRARAKRSRAGSAARSGGSSDDGGGDEPPPRRCHEAAVLLDVVELEAEPASLQAALARLALAWMRAGRTP